jgi:hypothetical protein
MRKSSTLLKLFASVVMITASSALPTRAEMLGLGFLAPAFLSPGTNTFDSINLMLDYANELADGLSDFLPDDSEDPGPNENATLGSNCLTDPECTACAENSEARANNAFEVLIKNERRLARTLRKAKMLENVAEGAGSQHAAAKAAYTIQLARSIEPAKRKFFENLGEAQNEALDVLRASLRLIGTCEQQHMGSATYLALAEHSYQIAKLRFALSLSGEAQ